ncbi:MAG: Tm-1-like ATP-binding domain-containing protein [Syntrophorhabdaceae bacterium]|nr:Tm-1-like ATP-binding domain-containing protein [Syntrophorhabdaceae bacterium]
MKKCIAILGTLDTKGREVAFMKKLIEDRGYRATVIDVGPVGPPGTIPDIPNRDVASWAGYDLDELIEKEKRDRVIEAMGIGARNILLHLYKNRLLDGVIGFGGNQGTAIGAMALKALPFGFPKYLISTVASGNIRPYIGCKDINVVFSVGDFLGGPNPLTRTVLANAVAAVIGMVEYGEMFEKVYHKPNIAITALGNTEKAARYAVELISRSGFQPIPFHASGAGGSAMEELIYEGFIHGVLDLTPHELTEEISGKGIYVPVNPGRLKAAGDVGIPQVVSLGGMEYLCFGPYETIPFTLRKRKIYMHNPYNANVKASTAELKKTAYVMAERLNIAKGPVAVVVPKRGWSVYGAKGGPLFSQGSYDVFVKALKKNLRNGITVLEVDAHINDREFVEQCVDLLVNIMRKEGVRDVDEK